MVGAGALIEAEVEDVAGSFLVDEHVVAVVDREGVEVEAQLLDAFGRSQFARSRLQARMKREVSLPHLLALERSGCITTFQQHFNNIFIRKLTELN